VRQNDAQASSGRGERVPCRSTAFGERWSYDDSRLKARLRPMGGLQCDRAVGVVIRGPRVRAERARVCCIERRPRPLAVRMTRRLEPYDVFQVITASSPGSIQARWDVGR
jgi:hypothetical protein